MVKLRTLSEAYNYIKEQDPGTALTPWALRLMVVSGDVPCIKSGKKYLIDMDGLFEHLTGKTEPKSPLPRQGELHPIPEYMRRR